MSGLDRIKSALPGEGDLREKLVAIVGNMPPTVKRAAFREIVRQLLYSNNPRWGRPAPGQGSPMDVAANLIAEIETIVGRRLS